MDAHTPVASQVTSGMLRSKGRRPIMHTITATAAATLAVTSLTCVQLVEAGNHRWQASDAGKNAPKSGGSEGTGISANPMHANKIYSTLDTNNAFGPGGSGLVPRQRAGDSWNVDLVSGLPPWEWEELGVYQMPLDKDAGLTCPDVMWEARANEGNYSMSDTGKLIRCGESLSTKIRKTYHAVDSGETTFKMGGYRNDPEDAKMSDFALGMTVRGKGIAANTVIVAYEPGSKGTVSLTLSEETTADIVKGQKLLFADAPGQTRCVKFVYLHGFPGNTTSVSLNGEKLFAGVQMGWHLSESYEIPHGVIEVKTELDGLDRSSDHSSRGYYGKDDDRLETIGTALMRSQDGMAFRGRHKNFEWQDAHYPSRRENHDYNPIYPFDEEGFFVYYMQMDAADKLYHYEEPADYNPCPPWAVSGCNDDGDPTALPVPSPTASPSAAPYPVPTAKPTTIKAPTPSPSAMPTKLTATPTVSEQPTGKPTMIPTTLPTMMKPRDIHPHVIVMGDGPYATQWGFDQEKMSALLEKGTVVFFTNTVATNFTDVYNFDNNCTDTTHVKTITRKTAVDNYASTTVYMQSVEGIEVGQRVTGPKIQDPVRGSPSEPNTYVSVIDTSTNAITLSRRTKSNPSPNPDSVDNTLLAGTKLTFVVKKSDGTEDTRSHKVFYNRSYSFDRSQRAVVCARRDDNNAKYVIANISYMDLSMAYFNGSDTGDFLNGWLTLHALPEIMPTSMPTVLPTTPMPSADPTSEPTTPAPSPEPTISKNPSTAAPTIEPTSGSPSDEPTMAPVPAPTLLPTTSSPPTMLDDPMCTGEVLASKKVTFEPNRIWYVGITGSYQEDRDWEKTHYEPEKSSGHPGYSDDAEIDKRDYDGILDRQGGFYKMRGVDYSIEVINEYGELTALPTMAPTFGETAVYLPSEFIVDPLKAQYENFVISCVLLGTCAVVTFVITRCAFNVLEARSTGNWMF